MQVKHRLFPLPKGGGPIEAGIEIHGPILVCDTAPFPLPKGGGPIEAG